MDYYKVIYAMQCSASLLKIFSHYKIKENVNYFFHVCFSDHGLLVNNDQH